MPKATRSFVAQFLAATHLVTDFSLDESVSQEAGAAHAACTQRRRQPREGFSKRLLVEFSAGAHPMLKVDRLLTSDARRYRVTFPKLLMIP